MTPPPPHAAAAGDGGAVPHVASLTSSLALVPLPAVPAIVDCVLAASSLSPSLLFHSLLPSPNSASQSVPIAAALCHLIKHADAPPDALPLFVSQALVPLLQAVDPRDSELLNQIEESLCDAVSKTRSWELVGRTLVPVCLSAIGLYVEIVRSELPAVFEWSNGDSVPLQTACHVLTSLLESSLRTHNADSFAGNLVWDLSHLALRLLSQSTSTENRSRAIRLLLPSVFSSLSALGSVHVLVNGSLETLSRTCFFKKIWNCCMSLFSMGYAERRDAYRILSLYFSSFSMEGPEKVSVDEAIGVLDLMNQKEFWEEIRRGLVDKDASVRKQALYILRISLSLSFVSRGSECDDLGSIVLTNNGETISHGGDSSCLATTKKGRWAEKEAKSLGVGKVCNMDDHNLTGRERWKIFILLYEMLEEYGTHLVEAAWTHQVSLLFHSMPLDSFSNHFTGGLYQDQMETLEGIFSWLAVLWERGFFHGNPHVRCLIMESFLDIDWDKYGYCAKKLPRSFILGPFIVGLNDVVHHKDFGVKGIYTSKSIQGATKYFCEFSRQLSLSERASFVWSLASVAREVAFGRAGLMALAFCVASAACPYIPHTVDELQVSSLDREQVEFAQCQFSLCSTVDLLEVLGIVVEKSKQHFNGKYRLQVSLQVLKAASSLISICDVPLDIFLHFLSTVPQEFTDLTGPLRGRFQQWLTQINKICCNFDSIKTGTCVLKNLISFPTSFIKHENPADVPVLFDDDEVDAWEIGAQRWARMLFLVVTEEKHLEPIFMFLLNHARMLCKPDINLDWIPLKLLILILSLVGEFQSGWRKLTRLTKAKTCAELGDSIILDQSSPLVTSIAREKLVLPFLPILEKLVSFAELVSPVLWSTSMVNDNHLPCSVIGKLGGPSQRRLSSLTSSSVLQAIFSIRAVACASSWCAVLMADDSLQPTFSFLWDYTMKVIQSPLHDSQTGAEIHLAAYEALVSVMKAFSTTFNPMVIDFIVGYNKSQFLNQEDGALLDRLILNFLKNINDLLATGVLTRSRRAVLMNWKWLCLDSMLSIPYNVKNEVHQWSSCTFFSDSTLRSTFLDIVESLENAGEISVLPMLRSVRLVLGLLCSCTRNSKISSCAVVNSQMLLLLVRPSWILHLSCNKRRVAPTAALLSAVLHQSIFSELSMHETIGCKQGPLKWFIEKLLDEGIKSPRTIRLAALHLTGLWFLYPKTIKYYIKELKLLSLYGSVAFDEDFEAELSENHEATIEVSMLAQSPDSELTEVFINTEMYARVSVAVLFYNLAKLANRREGPQSEDSHAAAHCGKLFLLELLNSAVNDGDLSKELYKKHSAIHRRKVRAWQMLCILSHFVEKDIVEEVTSNLHICLYRNNLPAVRQFLETFAIHIYLKFPSLADEQLVHIFNDYNMRPQALSSYVFIAANLILHSGELLVQVKHLNELLPPVIPLLTSHHHSLRGFTQLLVHHVLLKLWPALRPTSSELAPLEKKCFDDLKTYLAKNIDCVRLRASMEGFFSAFDPNTFVTPAGIFNSRNEGSDFECVPVSLLDQVITFLNDVREDLRCSMAKDTMALKYESLTIADACKDIGEGPKLDAESVSPITRNELSLDYQKKITLSEHVKQPRDDTDYFLGNVELSRLLVDIEAEDQLLVPVLQSRIQAVENTKRTQQPFILVASLVDRIPNLAGLVRTCEIFRAAGMVIADTSIVQDKQFQLISVTAEKWVPIIEVPVSSMKAFLQEKRREGFSILGLEQTANSMPLDQYSFPTKTVLVLGKENEGIPVDIIHVLDACVEIPQLGIIRSLNVHVSGAIAMWEYTRQQRTKQ